MPPPPRGTPPPIIIGVSFEREMKKAYLTPFLTELGSELKGKPYLNTTQWIFIVNRFIESWRRRQNISFPDGVVESWARDADVYQREAFIRNFKSATRVDISPMLNNESMRPILQRAISESTGYIKNLPERFGDGLEKEYLKAELESPLDLKAREEMFRRRGKISGYELRRITRDQTNKLVGALAKHRQTEAGIEEYVWQTSEDDRVRPTHSSKNGRIFRWDLNGGYGPEDTGIPGHDIQCRCTAIPKAIYMERIAKRIKQT